MRSSCNYALKSCDMPPRTLEEVRMFVGNGVKKLMERAVPGGLTNPRFEEAYAIFRQHYLHHNLDHTAPYPGIMEMLATLQANGKAVAVVSNKFYAATQQLVRHFFLSPSPLQFTSVTATSTSTRRRIVACPASVSCGGSETSLSSLTTVLPPLPLLRLTS